MHRAFPESAQLRRVLQVIWHQVSTAGEVFSVGAVNLTRLPTGGRAGRSSWRGTGKAGPSVRPAAEALVPVERRDWVAEAPPAITHERFAGAGTRSLSEDGRAAIRALFERSFGAPQS